jgi:hypothetical protein
VTKRNTFQGYQQAVQDAREALVLDFLAFLKTRRAKIDFENVTQLAEFVAKHVSSKQGRPCSRSTILRNRRYKDHLMLHLAARQPGSDRAEERGIKEPGAKAVLIQRDLAAENSRRENQRLKAYIAALEMATKTNVALAGASTQRSDRHVEDQLAATCQALFVVLQHFGPMLRADADATHIVDVTSRPPVVVVGPQLTQPFFAWLLASQNVGGR